MRKHIFYNTVNFQPVTFRILFFRGIQTLQMRLSRKACFWWTQLLRPFCRAADCILKHKFQPAVVNGVRFPFHYVFYEHCYAVVTPLRKAASYEPRIAISGIWGDTWLTRGKYGIYAAVRGSYGALTGTTGRLLPRKISPIYCRVSYVAVTRIPSLVQRNTWHYVI